MVAASSQVLAIILYLLSAGVTDEWSENEFLKYDQQGNLIMRGEYIRDDDNRVIRYNVYTADGELLYYETPHYRANGSIVAIDTYSPDGSLELIAIPLPTGMRVFDGTGKPVPELEALLFDDVEERYEP